MTEGTQCPLCGATGGERLPYPAPASGATQLHFDTIAVCAACGLGYALPRPTQAELDAFYAAGAYWHQTVGSNPQQVAHERNQCRQRVAAVRPYVATGSSLAVLDVGAGHGWTVDALAAVFPGIRLTFDFIEPDDRLSEAVLARCGSSFPVARRHDLRELDAQYDLIFLNHVLEHVAEPVAFLSAVRARLRPGAVLYVETPHRDYRFKSDVFPHTLFFDAATLSLAVTRAGLEPSRCESFGRWPMGKGSSPALLARIAYRAAVIGGPDALQDFFDGRIWDYRSRADGIWLRCVGRRPASGMETGAA